MTIYKRNKPSKLETEIYQKLSNLHPDKNLSLEVASACISDDLYFRRLEDVCFCYFPCVYQETDEVKGRRICQYAYRLYKDMEEKY